MTSFVDANGKCSGAYRVKNSRVSVKQLRDIDPAYTSYPISSCNALPTRFMSTLPMYDSIDFRLRPVVF